MAIQSLTEISMAASLPPVNTPIVLFHSEKESSEKLSNIFNRSSTQLLSSFVFPSIIYGERD